RAELTPTLGARDTIERWRETGLPWHLSIDTGMSRAGVQWTDVAALADVVAANPPQGAFTHFHSAERSDSTREQQESRFDEAVARLPVRPRMLHAENSPAVEHRGRSRWSVARPGVFLYGVTSGNSPQIEPSPV